jgi:ubiquinol-cytochrome c reductase cytochrome b subunit
VTLEPAIDESPTRRDAPLGGRFVGWASNYLDERTSLSGFV